jgi:hypothetical protein
VLVMELFTLGYESLYTFFAACYAQAVVQVLLGPIQYLFSRLYIILLHFSFWNGAWSTYPQRSKKTVSSLINDGGNGDEPLLAGGSVLVCNLQSPLDVFIIQRICWSTPAIFCMPCDDEASGNGATNKTPGVWWTIFRQVAVMRILSAGAIPKKLPQQCDVRALQMLGRRLGRPVVLFAEGVPTNGKAVLQLCDSIVTDPRSGDVIPVGITYHNTAATNTTIPQNLPSFLVRLIGESALSGGNTIDVSVGRPSLVWNLKDTADLVIDDGSSPSTASGVSDSSKKVAQTAHIRGGALQTILADTVSFERVSGAPCRTVAASGEDKASFYSMWLEHGKLV